MFQTLDEAVGFIRHKSVAMVDLKFCDIWGRWRHVTLPAARFNAALIESGVGFDGSSLGLTAVKSGDLVLVPELGTAFLDPFWDAPTISFLCATLEADTRRPFPHDPRTLAARAEEFLRASGVGDASLWGPEFEFYLFDGVSYENGMNVAAYRVESREADWKSHELGGGYTIPRHGGYHAIPPQDHLFNARTKICQHLEAMGVEVKYHHHEVGGPGQCEIETRMLPMVRAADVTLLAKYVARMTAREMGLTATFMPKPLYGEAGSGLHFHQQVFSGEENAFYDPAGYGCLSETARFYVGGLLAHGPAVMALTNPSTNSYRRLVPGYEAPVTAIFSLGNRSAAIRIPKYANRPQSARIEFRPPDATCNPYLAIAAQLMAGIDGVRRRIDPTERGFGPYDEDVFSWPAEKGSRIQALPTSLEQALDALERDHEFLLEGGVFSREMLDRVATRKRDEERAVRDRPHPYEIELYYDL
ncbi:MAG TPA: type I glutamate--ammonia ligase [Vicinamibacteria bacterium]|nr:type I glutamate--ammonia ligase [Vicinamibacteria bacterium]